MTWSKYHRNCVLTGTLDGFCLVCENHLKCEDDYTSHLDKPIHKKNLEATPYFEKYKNEYIRKVKKGYYCELCNLLSFTAPKVGLHVAEAQHKYNKHTALLRRVDNSIVTHNNELIEDKTWHGIIENTCVICNTEFDNEDIHKTEPSHILNLIQKSVEFGDDAGQVYRKTDDNTYHCLICNLSLALHQFSNHFEEDHHKENLERSRKLCMVILNNNETIGTPQSTAETINVKAKVASENVTEQTKCKPNVNNESIKQNEHNSETNKNKFDEKNNKSDENVSKDTLKSALEMDKYICDVLGAKNYITQADNGNSRCILCDWEIDSRAAHAHVNSAHHLIILKMHKDRLEKMSRNEKDPLMSKSKNDSPNLNKERERNADLDDKRSKLLDSLQEFQKNDININLEVDTASCKKCSKSIDLNYDAINSHIEGHKKKGNKKEAKQVLESGNEIRKENGNTSLYTKPVLLKNKDGAQRDSHASSDDKEIKEFATKNNLTYSNGKLTCRDCNTSLSRSIKSLKEHTNGAQHRSNSKTRLSVAPYKAPDLQKVPVGIFIKSLMNARILEKLYVVINEKYVLDYLSFITITKGIYFYICESCDELFQMNEINAHKATARHLKAQTDAMVVVVTGEFIREVRDGVFHCGYCGAVSEGWAALVQHLASAGHRESRAAAEWRLIELSADIQRRRWQDRAAQMAALLMSINRINRSYDIDSDSDY